MFYKRAFQLRTSSIPTVVVRLKSDALRGGKTFPFVSHIPIEIFFLDRPWDKSTDAVIDELPDVVSPAGLSLLQK